MQINYGAFCVFLVIISCHIIFALTNNESWQPSTRNDSNIESAGNRVLSRQKRYLIFPEGSNVQLVYCLTIGTYARKDLIVGLTAALAWELPSKVDRKLSKLLHRQSRSVIYPKIEAFLQSLGLDGKSCVLRAICEASQRGFLKIGSGTFVQELLHAIFRLRRDGTGFEVPGHREYDYAHETEGDCASLYPTCQYSIYALDF